MFPFLVLRYPIKSLRINFLPYPCFPFLSSQYWFPLPHWWYRRANGHGPSVCCLLCVLAMATDKAACLWLAAAGQPTGGAHCIFGWRKKRFDSKQSSFIFLYFARKTKDCSFPQTERFCKYVQNQSEGMHTQVREGHLGDSQCLHMNRAWCSEGLGSLKDLGHCSSITPAFSRL